MTNQARESQPAKKTEHVPGDTSGRGREGAPRNGEGGERGERERRGAAVTVLRSKRLATCSWLIL